MHLDVLPGQERPHAVPKEKIGKIRIFFLCHGAQGMDICDDTFVAIWMSKIAVLIICNNGCTVSEVIIGYYVIALLSGMLCKYIQMYGDGLAGAVIMGTGSQPGIVLQIGKLICRMIALFRGWEYRSAFVDNMAFGGYNKQFEPARTPSDWLTKDEAIIDACVKHPWSTFRFTVNGYYQMFRGIQYIQNPAHIQQIPKNLPLFFVAGGDDPVGNNGKSVTQVCQQYKDAGIRDVQIKLYPGDRHEILNETDRDVVYADILTWLNGHLA